MPLGTKVLVGCSCSAIVFLLFVAGALPIRLYLIIPTGDNESSTETPTRQLSHRVRNPVEEPKTGDDPEEIGLKNLGFLLNPECGAQ